MKSGFPKPNPEADDRNDTGHSSTPGAEPDQKPSSQSANIPRNPPQPGDFIKFQAGDFSGRGKVIAVGDDGVTIADSLGREHGIHWDEITGVKRQVNAETAKSDDNGQQDDDESTQDNRQEGHA